jgi:hypothetical protein
MKKYTFVYVGIITLALTVSAAALAERGSADRQQNMQRYTEMLDLTEQQRDALQALQEESTRSREARKAEMQEGLRAILTEEQMVQLEDHRDQRISQRAKKGDCEMKGANRAEMREMRQERRQSQDS